MLIDTAPAGSGLGAWLRNPGQLPASCSFQTKHFSLKLFTLHPRAHKVFWLSRNFGWGPTSSFSLGGAVGGSGEEVWTAQT